MKKQALAAALVGGMLLAGVGSARGRGDGGEEVLELLRRTEELEKQGKVDEAIAVRERLLDKAKQLYGADSTKVAAQMSRLARLHQDLGQYDKAETLLQWSLKIYEDKLGKDHPYAALVLDSLAVLYRDMAQYKKAKALHLRSVKILEDKLEKSHPDLSYALNNLALLYQDMGEYEKAEPLLRRALKIREDKLGGDHPTVGTSLNNLAGLYSDMGQYEKAEPLFRRSLKIYEDKLDKDHPRVALPLVGLGGLYRATKQYEKAESVLLRALKVREGRLGKDHPDVAGSLNGLARLYQATGRHEKAEPPLLRAVKLLEDGLGKDHPDVAESLNDLAELRAGRGKVSQAASMFDRTRRSSRHHLLAILPVLTERDHAAFFQRTNARLSLTKGLSLGLAHKGSADVAELSASWLINGKAPEQESLAAAELASREITDPALGKLSGRLLATRSRLARLTFSVPEPGRQKQRLEQIEALTGEEQDLAKQLRQAGSKAAPPEWLEVAGIRKLLPADAVLIDFARLEVFDFEAKPDRQWQPARYGRLGHSPQRRRESDRPRPGRQGRCRRQGVPQRHRRLGQADPGRRREGREGAAEASRRLVEADPRAAAAAHRQE